MRYEGYHLLTGDDAITAMHYQVNFQDSQLEDSSSLFGECLARNAFRLLK